MRVAFRVTAGVFFALFAATVAAAHADSITVTISATGAGSLGGQMFSGRQVTFNGQTSTAEVAACGNGTATDGCIYSHNQYQREYLIPYTGGTVSIAGLGTFGMTGTETMDFFAGVYDPEQIRLGGGPGGLTLGASMPGVSYDYNFAESLSWHGGAEGSFIDSQCQDGPPSQCQWFAPTTAGELRLTSVLPGADGQITLSAAGASIAPEPGTWALVSTGLIGAAGGWRSREQRERTY